jgi:hypothetical protein
LVVDLDQKVDKKRSHVPLKFRLHVHEVGGCQCRSLEKPRSGKVEGATAVYSPPLCACKQ